MKMEAIRPIDSLLRWQAVKNQIKRGRTLTETLILQEVLRTQRGSKLSRRGSNREKLREQRKMRMRRLCSHFRKTEEVMMTRVLDKSKEGPS